MTSSTLSAHHRSEPQGAGHCPEYEGQNCGCAFFKFSGGVRRCPSVEQDGHPGRRQPRGSYGGEQRVTPFQIVGRYLTVSRLAQQQRRRGAATKCQVLSQCRHTPTGLVPFMLAPHSHPNPASIFLFLARLGRADLAGAEPAREGYRLHVRQRQIGRWATHHPLGMYYWHALTVSEALPIHRAAQRC